MKSNLISDILSEIGSESEVKIKFTIGLEEKHYVEFYHDKGGIKWFIQIKVDGNIVYERRFGFLLRRKRSYIFEVGDKEKHEIKIESVAPFFEPAFRPWDYYIYVDGVFFSRH